MLHNSPYIRSFMERYRYPAAAADCFTAVEQRLDDEPDFGAAFDRIANGFLYQRTISLGEALRQIDALAEKYGVHKYTLEFVFIMNGTEEAKRRYAAAHLSDEVFYDTWDDLRCKLLECMECKGVPGTFVGGWYSRFFDLTLRGYGRFEYVPTVFDWDLEYTMKCGRVFRPGDLYLDMHIPSSGVPLTDEIRLDSYKKAYQVYAPLFPDGKIVIGTMTWLLYPAHRKFLPENSNVLRFMDDFELVSFEIKDDFYYDWRIFGADAGRPYGELPRDTSLRRAYADWLAAGNKAGDAFGIFLFDGEKIVR
ncbi:MAG: hypothetical protein IJL26_03260 [Clostridia bacterium]|nr:hypothetical protein [Clostridia bacterium]